MGDLVNPYLIPREMWKLACIILCISAGSILGGKHFSVANLVIKNALAVAYVALA